MGQAELCPSGSEITSTDECNRALEFASELGITLGNRKNLISGSWGHVPYQCSYQAGGDQAFTFNRRETNNVASFVNGGYRMICNNGACTFTVNTIVEK